MIESRLFITEKISTAPSVFRFARIPAVSISRYFLPSRSTITSIASRVVPGISEAMTRSNPASVLTSVDFPTFGRPHHGDPRKVGVLRVRLFPDVGPGGNPRDDRLEQFGYPRAVLGGNGMDRIDGEGVELGNAFPAFLRVHLVRGEQDRLPRSRSIPAISLSRGSSPSRESTRKTTRSDSDRPQDLPADLRKEVVLPPPVMYPGVDEKEMATVVLHRLGDEVPRDPRLVERDGAALPRHPVEEGGLPDIRAPHQRHREFTRLISQMPQHGFAPRPVPFHDDEQFQVYPRPRLLLQLRGARRSRPS